MLRQLDLVAAQNDEYAERFLQLGARPDQPLVGAHSACGTGWNSDYFPGCNAQGPLSFGQSRLADIQLVHRAFMYLTAISVLAMAALALRRRAPSRAE